MGGIGFFRGSDYVTAPEWQTYVNALDLEHNFPGIFGIGFIQHVTTQSMAEFLAAARAQQPEFQLHPDFGQPPYYVIKYIFPKERNRQATGLNIAFEAHRLEAAELSRDTGKPAITKKVGLVQDEAGGHGFLLLYPLYRAGMSTGTVDERRSAHLGWIYAPFSASSFMRELTASQGPNLRLRVYDGRTAPADALIYDSHAGDSEAVIASEFKVEKFRDVMQQPWTMVWSSAPSFEASTRSNEPLLILVGGLVFTSLFSVLLFVFAHRAETVRRLVDLKTQELADAQIAAEQARVRAETANEAKSVFLATMSHEIRTPLNSIIGYANLLLDNPKIRGSSRAGLAIVKNAGLSLINIVNDILDFSTIEAGRMKLSHDTCHLASIAESCLTIVDVTARAKSLAVTWSIDEDFADVGVLADEQRLKQILLNLLNNAIKFTERGNVSLSVHAKEMTPRLLRIRFEVSDTGDGIPAAGLPHLFERFSQLDPTRQRRYGGTGLGLAICKKLVEQMDGTIGVDSTVGLGSTFWFEIPLIVARDVMPPVRVAPPAATPAANLSILVVDDLDLNRDLAAAVLRRAGHTVTTASSGPEAIRRVLAEPFDVVLMDVQMPEMDGISAAQAIRKAESDGARVPIIAMTANVLPSEVELCFAAGMDDHIGKPFDRSDLIAKVRAAAMLRAAA